jgi:hypothetical protein
LNFDCFKSSAVSWPCGPRSRTGRVVPRQPARRRRASASGSPSHRFAISRGRQHHLRASPEQIALGARSSTRGMLASAVVGPPPRRPLAAHLRRLLPRLGPLLSSSSFKTKPQRPIASPAAYKSQLLPPGARARARLR